LMAKPDMLVLAHGGVVAAVVDDVSAREARDRAKEARKSVAVADRAVRSAADHQASAVIAARKESRGGDSTGLESAAGAMVQAAAAKAASTAAREAVGCARLAAWVVDGTVMKPSDAAAATTAADALQAANATTSASVAACHAAAVATAGVQEAPRTAAATAATAREAASAAMSAAAAAVAAAATAVVLATSVKTKGEAAAAAAAAAAAQQQACDAAEKASGAVSRVKRHRRLAAPDDPTGDHGRGQLLHSLSFPLLCSALLHSALSFSAPVHNDVVTGFVVSSVDHCDSTWATLVDGGVVPAPGRLVPLSRADEGSSTELDDSIVMVCHSAWVSVSR
jgi:hypothetical protein